MPVKKVRPSGNWKGGQKGKESLPGNIKSNNEGERDSSEGTQGIAQSVHPGDVLHYGPTHEGRGGQEGEAQEGISVP